MFHNGIIIEGDLAEALLRQAIAEGFCKAEPDEESRAKPRLATGPMRDRLGDVLGLMLLYGKVVLPTQDYLSRLHRLGEIGLVQFEPYPQESRFDLSTRAGAQQLFDTTKYQLELLRRVFPPASTPWGDRFLFVRLDPLVTYVCYTQSRLRR